MMDTTGTRSASPASKMLESDWSYATKELLQVTGKDIIEERCVMLAAILLLNWSSSSLGSCCTGRKDRCRNDSSP